MRALRRCPFLLVLLLGLTLGPAARADDPPALDVLASLGLEAEREVAGVAHGHQLPCRVVDASWASPMFEEGDRVFLIRLDKGSFRVVPDAPGLTACAVGKSVHLADLFSPAPALVALGLRPSADPLPARALLNTTVTSPERLATHGVSCDKVGALVTVRNGGSGRWSIAVFGREPSLAVVDVRPFFLPQTPVSDVLERATVELSISTLSEGGRLLARVAEPARLEPLGIQEMPAGDQVMLTKGAEARWRCTTLSPGFTREAEIDGLDLKAQGLEDVRLLDLPQGGSIHGRLEWAWKAAKEGLKGARSRDRVEVARDAEGRYVLRNLERKRPGSVVIPGP